MLHEFLDANRAELIERCEAKVALRPARRSGTADRGLGVPAFLAQLIETLREERSADAARDRASPPSTGPPERAPPSQIILDAAKHGHDLLRKGYTVDQVVHDYGDLCQSVAELAIERDAPISTDEFKTLNRCLDFAIAGAVTEYDRQRDHAASEHHARALGERLGFLAHELRNFLNTAVLAFAAVKCGSVGIDGPTSRVIDRSLGGLRDLIDQALADVRLASGVSTHLQAVPLEQFVSEAAVSARLAATLKGCELEVAAVEPGIVLQADQQLLHSALSNLLQNAFKFTHPGSRVQLRARASDERVAIEVEDRCGGLPEGKTEALFLSFEQAHADRSGLGLGLAIARRAVESGGGTLQARDLPGVGCVFTIDMPRTGHCAAANSQK